jgi:hypothetical protein
LAAFDGGDCIVASPHGERYAGWGVLMAFNRPIPENMRGGSRSGRKQTSGLSLYVQAEKMLQIAVLLPATAFIGWLVGAWLGGKVHQSWMGLAGILLGGIGGLVYVVRLVMVSGNHDSPETNVGDGEEAVDPAKRQ